MMIENDNKIILSYLQTRATKSYSFHSFTLSRKNQKETTFHLSHSRSPLPPLSPPVPQPPNQSTNQSITTHKPSLHSHHHVHHLSDKPVPVTLVGSARASKADRSIRFVLLLSPLRRRLSSSDCLCRVCNRGLCTWLVDWLD